MEVKVYKGDTGELVFHYTDDMKPFVSDHSTVFTVYYDDDCVCDYLHRDYYYETIKL